MTGSVRIPPPRHKDASRRAGDSAASVLASVIAEPAPNGTVLASQARGMAVGTALVLIAVGYVAFFHTRRFLTALAVVTGLLLLVGGGFVGYDRYVTQPQRAREQTAAQERKDALPTGDDMFFGIGCPEGGNPADCPVVLPDDEGKCWHAFEECAGLRRDCGRASGHANDCDPDAYIASTPLLLDCRDKLRSCNAAAQMRATQVASQRKDVNSK